MITCIEMEDDTIMFNQTDMESVVKEKKPKKEKADVKDQPKKLTRKERLVQDVAELYGDMDITELQALTMVKLQALKDNYKIRSDTTRLFPGSSPSQMPETKQECQKLMAETINEKLGDLAADKPIQLEKSPEVLEQAVKSIQQQASKTQADAQEMFLNRRAKTLFNYHLFGAGILETLTCNETVESHLGSNLAGLSKDMLDEKEEFLEILKDLYQDYQEEIDPYINSITVYSLFMSNKISQRFMENKKNSLNGTLPKSRIRLGELLNLSEQRLSSSSSSAQFSSASQPILSREDNIKNEFPETS